jgi:hypothetical protein
MNYTFRSAYNSGFRNSSSYFNSNFKKSFFNNKMNTSFFNSSHSRNFTINFSNKYFMTKMLSLVQCQSLLGRVNKTISCGVMSSFQDEGRAEAACTESESLDSLILIGEFVFLKDDCKWTCGTRLSSGPVSPVLLAR